jgi:ketosteroid isomerase-like protein
MEMKRCFILFFLFLLLFSCIKRREIKVESEKTIVENTIREYLLALESADKEKVLDFYIKSPNIVLIGTGNEYLIGYEAVERYYEDLTSLLTKWQNKDFALSALDVRILDGVAWFSSRLKFNYELDNRPMEEDIRFTGVLIKDEGNWKFVQIHKSFSSP